MRLFFAIMLPSAIQAQLGRFRQRCDWLPIRGQWTAQENLHITVRFLGEATDTLAADVCSAIRTEPPPVGPMQVRPDRLIYFPPTVPARVLGVGFAGDVQPMIVLQNHIETICQILGLAPENRPYVPHATLARFRDGLQLRHKPQLERDAGLLAGTPAFGVNEFQLMQSFLDSSGPRYVKLASWNLGRSTLG